MSKSDANTATAITPRLNARSARMKPSRRAAVKDAQRWLKQSDCWNAVALCYPKELAEPEECSLGQLLKNTEDLHSGQG